MSKLPEIVKYIEAVLRKCGNHRTANDILSYARQFLEDQRDEAGDEEPQSPIGICENCRWWDLRSDFAMSQRGHHVGECHMMPVTVITEACNFCSHWTAKGGKP